MSETKHTPGKWRIELSDSISIPNGDAWLIDSDEYSIAEMCCPDDMVQANANLIAAAPDLLAACKFTVSVLREQGMFDLSEKMAVEKLNAAITKALGGEV